MKMRSFLSVLAETGSFFASDFFASDSFPSMGCFPSVDCLKRRSRRSSRNWRLMSDSLTPVKYDFRTLHLSW